MTTPEQASKALRFWNNSCTVRVESIPGSIPAVRNASPAFLDNFDVTILLARLQ